VARNDSLHIPVLLEQTLEVLAPRPGQTFVDCTLGLGGHAAAILERLKPDGRLIAFDLDAENIADARVQLQRVKGREGTVAFDLIHDNFANIEQGLDRLGIKPGTVDGVLADIGVASTQIDDPSRGFSYRRPGPLDMRMDPSRGTPAHELVNTLSEPELADVIWKYGDEESSRAIARLIVKHRKTTPIQTTQQLMAIVCEARNFTLERAAGAKLHPAARTFQALRILVNGELDNLDRLLNALPRMFSSQAAWPRSSPSTAARIASSSTTSATCSARESIQRTGATRSSAPKRNAGRTRVHGRRSCAGRSARQCPCRADWSPTAIDNDAMEHVAAIQRVSRRYFMR
jgi:16S rRNA (cytosine1402-N4)-methyltransferase